MRTAAIQTSVAPRGPDRLGALDGLRGLAACGVAFLYHAAKLFEPAHAAEPALQHWFHLWGWTLVDLFFVISGFIFAHVYAAGSDGRDTGLERPDLANFAVARIARLYPLHFVMLLVSAALFWREPVNTAFAFVANMLMLQDFVAAQGLTFNEPSWSISIEVVCYVLFALALVRGRGALLRASIAAVVLSALLLAWFGKPDGPWLSDTFLRGPLGFFLGVLLWFGRERLARVPAIALVAVAAAGLLLEGGQWSPLLRLGLLTWPAIVLLALRLEWMGSAPMRWLGDRSYAIYLVHQPVVKVLGTLHGPFAGNPASVAVTTLALAAGVLALAEFSYRMIEVPARRGIRRAWAQRSAAGGAIVAA